MTSVLILVAMVGAVVLARRERRGQRSAGQPDACRRSTTTSCSRRCSSAIGTAGVFLRRNLITILLSIEIMLNAVNLTFVAFGRALGTADGQIIVFFVMTVAAAEAAVGLAIVIALFRHRRVAQPRHVHAAEMVNVTDALHAESQKSRVGLVVAFDAAADSAAAVPRVPAERQLRAAAREGGLGRGRVRGDAGVVRRVARRRSWRLVGAARPKRAPSTSSVFTWITLRRLHRAASRCGSIRCRR